MPEHENRKAFEAKTTTNGLPICTCAQDPFSHLPADERPKQEKKKDGIREVSCPGCGMQYLTNRTTDLCLACETGRD